MPACFSAAAGGGFEDGREAAAGAAPGRPEIDDHDVVFVDGGFEVVLGEFDDGHGEILGE